MRNRRGRNSRHGPHGTKCFAIAPRGGWRRGCHAQRCARFGSLASPQRITVVGVCPEKQRACDVGQVARIDPVVVRLGDFLDENRPTSGSIATPKSRAPSFNVGAEVQRVADGGELLGVHIRMGISIIRVDDHRWRHAQQLPLLQGFDSQAAFAAAFRRTR